jgi:prophage regulatory protein
MEKPRNPQGELTLRVPEAAEQPKHQRILRLAQVREVTGLGRSCIYQLQAQKEFPQRIKIGVRAVGWIESEVQQWVAKDVLRVVHRTETRSPELHRKREIARTSGLRLRPCDLEFHRLVCSGGEDRQRFRIKSSSSPHSRPQASASRFARVMFTVACSTLLT